MSDSLGLRETAEAACIGCGLCAALDHAGIEERGDGFVAPDMGRISVDTLRRCCPVVRPTAAPVNPWGEYVESYEGWSEDPDLRTAGSSGGVTTALACHLLESKRVDRVLCVRAPAEDPLFAEPVLCSSPDEVRACTGSRYVSCATLRGLERAIDEGDARIAIIARPCEVRAVRLLQESRPELKRRVPYLLSFFCAGVPSRHAARRLLESMGVEPACLAEFRYRGNGWPGYATAKRLDGTEERVGYEDSWGRVLGRDVAQYCRFCPDGIGEFADVACADYWYRSEDGGPDFSERDGRNIVFARSTQGNDVLKEMASRGLIHLKRVDRIDLLSEIQRFQYERRVTLKTRNAALALCGREFRSVNEYRGFWREVLKFGRTSVRILLGTIKRTVSGKISLP